MKKLPIKKLLLAGAGHAHIGLLRRLSTERPANADSMNIDITLISEQPQTIYSGMLPGWMAGHYHIDDISIDIISLCRRAGVRFIQQAIVKVNAQSRTVTTTDDEHFGFDYNYDVLSLNTGADTDMRWLNTTDTAQTTTSTHTALTHKNRAIIPIRPLSEFINRWQQIIKDAKQATNYRLAIIGGGAAATELVMAAQVALQRINPNHQAYLICGEHLLSGFNQRFKRRVISQLERHNIIVIQVRATGYSDGYLLVLCGSLQDSLPMDIVIAATGVTGAAWTQQTDLETTHSDTADSGFIAVNATQQSISHPNVFAVGDVATRVDQKVAHSGVHAVHGGAVMADNLLSYIVGKSLPEESVSSKPLPSKLLKKYQPSSRTLYLLSCGDKYAIASWGNYSLQGHWVWYLKQYIDKRFVKAYQR